MLCNLYSALLAATACQEPLLQCPVLWEPLRQLAHMHYLHARSQFPTSAVLALSIKMAASPLVLVWPAARAVIAPWALLQATLAPLSTRAVLLPPFLLASPPSLMSIPSAAFFLALKRMHGAEYGPLPLPSLWAPRMASFTSLSPGTCLHGAAISCVFSMPFQGIPQSGRRFGSTLVHHYLSMPRHPRG